jgi:hypothetical protein
VTVDWFDACGVTFCCDTHHNRVVSIQSDGRAYTYAGGDASHKVRGHGAGARRPRAAGLRRLKTVRACVPPCRMAPRGRRGCAARRVWP